jgi:MarR family transcriptional regulator for hemolysin
MKSDYNVTDFDRWAQSFYEQYDRGSRREHEFRLTRMLVIAARKWTSHIDEAIKQRTGYTRARWQALSAITLSGVPVSTLELSERMGIQWPTLIRTLNELEAEGLITREQDPNDRRYRLVAISTEGRQVLKDVREILDPMRSELLAHLSEEEMIETERVLRRLLAGLLD